MDPETRAGHRSSVRVATLNLWGRNGAWAERRTVLTEGFRALAPDIVAFQEAIRTDGDDQVGELLGSGFQVAHQTGGLVGDGNTVAIASRWPLGDVQEVDLNVTARTADFPCTTLVAEVLAPAPFGPLLVANHFPSFQLGYEAERELQAVTAARRIETLAGPRHPHVVLAGDLDATPDAASVRFLRGRQTLDGMSVVYQDAWERTHPGEPGHTFTPSNPLVGSLQHPLTVGGEPALEPGRRIDYIMVRCGDHGPSLGVAACERIFDTPSRGVWASDHFGVMADLVALAPNPAAPA